MSRAHVFAVTFYVVHVLEREEVHVPVVRVVEGILVVEGPLFVGVRIAVTGADVISQSEPGVAAEKAVTDLHVESQAAVIDASVFTALQRQLGIAVPICASFRPARSCGVNGIFQIRFAAQQQVGRELCLFD